MVKGMFLFLLVLVLAAAFIVKPGVYFVPPSVYETTDYTLIYAERQEGMPFFASPESLCLAENSGLTDLCLETKYELAGYLSRRLITRLPYEDWASQLFLPLR